MPIEQLLIYVVLAVIFFVKFVADTLKRQREVESSERASAPAPALPEREEHWSEPPVEPYKQRARLEAEARPVVVPVPRALEQSAARQVKREPRARTRRQAPLQPAVQHRMALGNRAELRRAVELMAILGPPRSLSPYDT